VTEAAISAEGFQQTDKDIVPLFALPMYHAAGFVIAFLTTISSGGTVIMLPGLSVSQLTQTIEKEKATVLVGVPFVFTLMVRMAESGEINIT